MLTANTTALSEGRCDIRIWSGECVRKTFGDRGEKYLCEQCETIPALDHEVCHDFYSYVSGDYDTLM